MAFLEPGIWDSKEISWGTGFRDCIYGLNAGFSIIMKRDPGNHLFDRSTDYPSACCNKPFSFVTVHVLCSHEYIFD